jgi:2-aminobenzoate-CoA ligase
MPTAHTDTFARDHLPAPELQPQFLLTRPELQFPELLNCATELLDNLVAAGQGAQPCLRAPGGLLWSYADLQERANRIANVLVNEMGLQPGNRVLLRAPNNPMLVACWFGVMKAGGIAVATMPLLRAKELRPIIEIGRVTHALCDANLAEELKLALPECPGLQQVRWFHSEAVDALETAMARQSPQFTTVATAADDCCIFAFTSGTTGVPKCTMHFHRDVMAACACWPTHHLQATAADVFIGSPPLAFTFGLGGLVLFPMSLGASTVLLEKASPQALLHAVPEFGATVLFTAPTSYRAMAPEAGALRGQLRKCVSAGEALPASTRALWKQATGIELIDGIGATELLHIFISHTDGDARPGATGKPVPGYVAKVVDDEGRELPPGTVGKLAVQGPTGCRYLADARQTAYVKNGWNLTGDAYLMDADGWFHYQARTDDMIISAGYNIASPEVEEALLQHPAVAECGVIGVPDPQRGQIVKAFVVLRTGHESGPAMTYTLQEFVKAAIAPYKYPRAIHFVPQLPRTQTGKLQRFRLHEL